MNRPFYYHDCSVPRYVQSTPLDVLIDFTIQGPFYYFVCLVWLVGTGVVLFEVVHGSYRRTALFLPGGAALLQLARVGLAALLLCNMDMSSLHYTGSALLASLIGSVLMFLPLVALAATISSPQVSYQNLLQRPTKGQNNEVQSMVGCYIFSVSANLPLSRL